MVKEASGWLQWVIESCSKRIRPISDPVASLLLSLFDSLTEFDEEEAHDDAKEIAEEHFQQKFAERMLVYPMFSILFLLLVAVIDVVQCGALSNQMYGLALDLIGAMILGRGLLMGGVAMGAVSEMSWDYNPLLIKSMAKDSVDGVWGMSLILVGIALQILAFGQFFPALPTWATSFC